MPSERVSTIDASWGCACSPRTPELPAAHAARHAQDCRTAPSGTIRPRKDRTNPFHFLDAATVGQILERLIESRIPFALLRRIPDSGGVWRHEPACMQWQGEAEKNEGKQCGFSWCDSVNQWDSYGGRSRSGEAIRSFFCGNPGSPTGRRCLMPGRNVICSSTPARAPCWLFPATRFSEPCPNFPKSKPPAAASSRL